MSSVYFILNLGFFVFIQLSDTATLLNAIEAYFVANNDLVGSIPDAYFNDDSLRYIDFSGNSLSGEIFSDVSEDSKLISINFASNSLSGPIIGRIRKLTDLEVLNIESNDFSGTLPSKLFTLNLTELSVGGNEFTGTIPGQLPKMSTLTSLSLGPNKFTGDIPTSLKELTALKKLSIVGIPDLGGRLPASYGLNLTDLVELSIAETNVDGDIPDLYAQMTKLETLQLNNNNIRGRIPRGLSLLTNLSTYYQPCFKFAVFMTLFCSFPNCFLFTEKIHRESFSSRKCFDRRHSI